MGITKTASYSASLLEAWNPNLSTYSMSIPSGRSGLDRLGFLVRLWPRLQKVSRWVGQLVFKRSRQALLR